MLKIRGNHYKQKYADFMIAILSLLNLVMSSVIQFDKSIHPMVLYENDLISIVMNVYVNLKKIGK